MIRFHTVTLNNIPLHYAEAPSSGPTLVIIHGLSGSHAEFLHLVPDLVQHAHVYLLDLRGHGLSGRGKGYQVTDYGRDVAAFLEQVVGRPAILLGHSLGGLVAIWLARYIPHLLQGIILEDPPLYILQMPRFGETFFYPYFTDLHDYLRRYHANGAVLDAMVAYVGQMPVDDTRTVLDVAGPEAVQERACQLHQLDPVALEPALAGTLFDSDEPDDLLAQIRCPVHLLATASAPSGAMSAEDVTRARAQISHCTHAIIENAGHDIHLDQPALFLREVKGFLTAVGERILWP